MLNSSIAGIEFSNSVVMNDELVSSKVIPRSEGFISRRFVLPYNSTPNLLRLHFQPKHSRSLRKNYGYKLVANRPLDEEACKKKHRLIHQFIIDTDREDSFSTTTLHGKALHASEAMATSLV